MKNRNLIEAGKLNLFCHPVRDSWPREYTASRPSHDWSKELTRGGSIVQCEQLGQMCVCLSSICASSWSSETMYKHVRWETAYCPYQVKLFTHVSKQKQTRVKPRASYLCESIKTITRQFPTSFYLFSFFFLNRFNHSIQKHKRDILITRPSLNIDANFDLYTDMCT